MKIKNKNVKGFVFLILGAIVFLVNSFRITGGVIGTNFSFSFVSLIGLVFFMVGIFIFMTGEDLEAIVVPTGPSYEADRQRAKGGASEYHKHEKLPHHSDVVIISGEFDKGRFFGSQPDKIYRVLRRNGVPKKDIILENESGTTIENVLYTCDEINKRKIDEVTVVTDALHAERFKMLFKRAQKKGYASKDLEVHTYSEQIDPSYGWLKAKLAYLKDMFAPLKKEEV